MSHFRVECPECGTSYRQDRLGVRELRDGESATLTITCKTCGAAFDARVQPNIVTVTPGWFARVVRRQRPTERQEGVIVQSTQR